MLAVAIPALAVAVLFACSGQTDRTIQTNGSGAGGAGGEASSDGADASPDQASGLPPPGGYNCTAPSTITPTQGDGQCVPPAGTSTTCNGGCLAPPGAPGLENCPAPAEGFGSACCTDLSYCGFDFDGECRTGLALPDETVPGASPCGPASATPERILEGRLDHVEMTADWLVIGNHDDQGSLTFVSHATCQANETFFGEPINEFVVVGDTAYAVGSDPATGYGKLFGVSRAGAVSEVPLKELFGAYAVALRYLVASDVSLYVHVAALPSQPSLWDGRLALVEIPCCGSAPRILATGLAWPEGGDRAMIDGQNLVVGGFNGGLDQGGLSSIGVFDLSTRQARVFFDTFSGGLEPFAVDDGRLFFVRGSTILSMGLADCGVEIISERRSALNITALASDGGDVFWAEAYRDLIGTRIFVRRADGSEALVAQVGGSVSWIGVDSERVYWTMFRDATPGTVALVRRQRP